MSEKKRNKRAATPNSNSLNLTENSNLFEATEVDASFIEKTNFLKNSSASQKLWVIGIIALLSLGALGSGLKYLEDSAKQQKAVRANGLDKQTDGSLLSSVNPFLEPPPPTPTPQLSKEYIYAGSRMLAVEDANASALPPSDLAVWRPSTGYWYVMGSQGSQATSFPWGGTTGGTADIPVPGDYDGDGKTDFSVFRPSTGIWYIVRSSDGSTYNYAFGLNGDRPAQADFDGDGKTDAAIFRPSSGTWYIQRSSDAGLTVQAFGLSTDVIAPADYDGDGKADIAFWRGTDYSFYILRSTDGTYQYQTLSAASTEVASADYDGDGKADCALRNGTSWIIKYSGSGQTQTITWQAGDKAVQNDYDGDGKVDIAVWSNSNGNWYIRQSSHIGQSNELRQVAWGTGGDFPVSAFYRR